MKNDELALLIKEKKRRGLANVAKQGAAGVIPGVTSAVDVPSFLINMLMRSPEFEHHSEAVEQLTGSPLELPQIPYYGSQLGSNIANSLVGEPQNEAEKFARVGGEVAGSFINPGAVIGKGLNGLAKGISGFSPAKYKAFEEAGLTPSLAEVSNSRPVMRAQDLLSQIPGASGLMNRAYGRREKELGQIFNESGQIEKALPVGETGELLQKGGSEYNKKAISASNKLYEKAWKGIDPKAKVPLNKTLNAIDQELEAITPEAREILQGSSAGKALIRLENAIKNHNGELPFGDVKNVFRKDLDNLISSWGQVGSVEQATLKNIRRNLSEEMNSFVLNHNPKASRDLKKADQFYAKFSERNRDIANNAIQESNPVRSFEKVVNDLKRGDTETTKVLLQRLPQEDKATLSATILNEMGREGENFNPTKWARDFNKLRPESQNMALSGLPKESAKKLKAVAEALENTKLAKAQGNFSGTAYTLALLGLGGGVSLPVAAKTIAGGIGASALFISPKAIDGFYALTKAKTPSAVDKVIDKFGLPARNILMRRDQENSDNSGLDALLKERERRLGKQ